MRTNGENTNAVLSVEILRRFVDDAETERYERLRMTNNGSGREAVHDFGAVCEDTRKGRPYGCGAVPGNCPFR